MADVAYNTQKICGLIDRPSRKEPKVVAFPELCVTGYTCGDLFTQEVLLRRLGQPSIRSRHKERMR